MSYYSTIFKTFDSDTGKFISKIGILGQSFDKTGEKIRQRKLEITDLMGAMSETDAKKQVGSFWDYIFGGSSDKKKPYDLSTFVELDETSAGNILKKLQEFEGKVNSGSTTWQEYFSKLEEGQKWQAEFVQNNDLQKASIDDVIAANKAAREAAIAHNNSLKQLTLGAKASKLALKGLATVGNIFAGILIATAIDALFKGIDNLVHGLENAKEHLKDTKNEFTELKGELDNTNSKLEENKKLIEDLNSKDKLTYLEKGQLEELKETTKELERQRSIQEIALKNQADKLAKENKRVFQREFKDDSFSENDVYQLESAYNVDRLQ